MSERTPSLAPLTRASVTLALALVFATGCSSPAKLELPELVGLRHALPIADAQTERGEGPPDWVNQTREDDEWVYGLGVARQTRSAEEGLYRALSDARTAVLDHLHDRGALAPSPGRLGPPLQLDSDLVEFEAAYLDERSSTWYALARIDRKAAAEAILDWLKALDAQTVRDLGSLADGDESIAVALRVLIAVDRRSQLEAQLRALGADVPAPPTDRGEVTGIALARDVLSRHPFAIEVDAQPVPGLEGAVRSTLGEFAIGTDEFWQGNDPRVTVRLVSGGEWTRKERYLRIEGLVELALGDGPLRTTPIRAVATGHSEAEARDRVARIALNDVVAAVRSTLREAGATGIPAPPR